MRFIIFIIFLCFLAALCSCAKSETIQPTSKRVFIISKRFTNPPEWIGSTWKPYKIVEHEILNVDYQPYENLKADTIISTCSIDKVDSSFKIEIRSYQVK
jgi:hypothetical protein